MKRYFPIFLAVLLCATALQAQNTEVETPNPVPVYRVVVVARTIKAINYRHRSDETKVEFRGTDLMPDARGEADVQSKQGTIKVDVHFKHLRAASGFGPEYMTYVLWAISPEGRPVNLGEVLPDNSGNSRLTVTSDLQSFGMIVTVEPHFAVTRPSDDVVMENFITDKTNGTVQDVEAKYELLKRGQYTAAVKSTEVTPIAIDPKTPIEIYEARNAIRIARWAHAETYAADTLAKAELDLRNAEDLNAHKGNKKDAITNAREAAQLGEDARMISVRKMEAEEQARIKQSEVNARARAESEAAAAARAREETENAQREKAASEAAKVTAEAETLKAQEAALRAHESAERAKIEAEQAEKERLAMRARLQQQLNTILETHDSARGLIMNMSDVLFDTGKYTLKPIAREKLAKVAGILLAYPGLSIEIDGHTDSVGGDEFNQKLSEERANSVRDYLTAQQVSAASITAKGFGKTQPVASNDTAQGRQQNRRVELVVSGDAIRSQLTTPPSQ